jgi:hypothetical protein
MRRASVASGRNAGVGAKREFVRPGEHVGANRPPSRIPRAVRLERHAQLCRDSGRALQLSGAGLKKNVSLSGICLLTTARRPMLPSGEASTYPV